MVDPSGWLTGLLVFVTGLCFGSAVSAISWRLPRGIGIGAGRSACPSCKVPLEVRSLVPVFSWLLQRGRCHACRAAIHWRYPLIELTTGLAFVTVWKFHGIGPEAAILALLTVVLMVMIVIDFEHRLLPDSMQWAAAILAVCYLPFGSLGWIDSGVGMLVGGFAGWLLQAGYRRLRGREGLGTGDVKFLAVCGLWIGAAGFPPLFLYSGLLGILTAMVWRLRSDDPLFPFGPALAASLWALVVWPMTNDFFWHWPQIFFAAP